MVFWFRIQPRNTEGDAQVRVPKKMNLHFPLGSASNYLGILSVGLLVNKEKFKMEGRYKEKLTQIL